MIDRGDRRWSHGSWAARSREAHLAAATLAATTLTATATRRLNVGGYGYSAGGYVPPPPPSAIVASGFLDASGRARLDERQLQLGTPHRVHLAYAAPPAAGGYGGYASAPRSSCH